MKCNDSRRKSKYNNAMCAYVNALRRGKCNEKDLFDNKMKHMFLHVNRNKKTRNHLPSIDVTRHTFTNNNNNTLNNNALQIYKPFICKDNGDCSILHQHQYSNSLSTHMSSDKDYHNLDYSLHNTYSQFLLGYSHKTKSSNKHHHHYHHPRQQETFEYFTFVPSSKHMKNKQRIKSDIVNMKYNMNDISKDKDKEKKESYVNKEEFWNVKGAKKPYYIANAIREECMRKLHKRKLEDIEIKPTNTSTDYNNENDTYDHMSLTNNNYYIH